jgi:spermidine synthase
LLFGKREFPVISNTSTRQNDNSADQKSPHLSHAAAYIIAFCASASLMAMEIASGRLIARQFGNSLYTWTSILTVILTGVTIGYYAGGRLADRFETKKITGWLSHGASISLLVSLTIIYYLGVYTPLKDNPYPVRVLGSTAMAFILPSILLGTISPVMVKRVLNLSSAGRIIGIIGAISTVGGICGTIGAGFWLIPLLGPEGIVLAAALAMVCIGWSQSPKRFAGFCWILLTGAVFYFSIIDTSVTVGRYRLGDGMQTLGFQYKKSNYIYAAESQYHSVFVYDEQSPVSHSQVRALCLDHLIHGFYNLDDPGELGYEYERIYREITWRYSRNKDSIAAFVLGAGSYTYPRWLQYEWPSAKVDVAEIDPVVVEANHIAIGLPRTTPIHTYLGDARNTIDNLPDSLKYDFFYGDAFDDLSVPWHLTTLEFIQKMKNHLRPDGIYLMNIIDKLQSGLFLGSSYVTMKKIFTHVYLFQPNRDTQPYRRETFVIAASDIPFDLDDWDPKYGMAGSVLGGADLDRLLQKSGVSILTDDYAPVDNLLAPVISER